MKNTMIKACMALALCSTFCSCTEKFVEINTNPNKINFGDAAPTSLYEPLLYGIGINNQYQAWFFANELVQVTAFTSGQTTQIHQYQIPDGTWQSQWDNYARYGFDAHHLIAQAISREDKYMEALGLIIKVYCLSNLSALFGDIPYKEAYMQTANTSPVFDSQEELAAEFIADLDSAAVILKRKPTVTKSGLDKMYSDNYTNWIKFANSLRMRILCRMSGISDSYWARIQQMVDNPADYPVFADNSDNATIPFSDADPYIFLYRSPHHPDDDRHDGGIQRRRQRRVRGSPSPDIRHPALRRMERLLRRSAVRSDRYVRQRLGAAQLRSSLPLLHARIPDGLFRSPFHPCRGCGEG